MTAHGQEQTYVTGLQFSGESSADDPLSVDTSLTRERQMKLACSDRPPMLRETL